MLSALLFSRLRSNSLSIIITIIPFHEYIPFCFCLFITLQFFLKWLAFIW